MNANANSQEMAGSLSEWPLDYLISSLAKSTRTGLLETQDSKIWFDKGAIYLVTTPNSPSLLSVLFSCYPGNFDELHQLFTNPEPDKSILESIFNKYPNSTANFQAVLKEFNLSGLFELLVPSQSDFIIKPDIKHKLGSQLSHDAQSIISQSSQRIEVWSKIAKSIPSVSAVFKLNPILPPSQFEKKFSSEDWKYISRINGTNDLETIIEEIQENPFKATATIYRLLLEGAIVEKTGS